MKKFWLRMLASVLSAAMIFSAAGCDKNGGIVDNGKYLEGHIEVKIVKAGYCRCIPLRKSVPKSKEQSIKIS